MSIRYNPSLTTEYESMLQTSGLGCERNGRVLFENLSFAVAAGEILRVDGTNGAGKTTLLRVLCGLYQDYEGEIAWDLSEYPLYVGHRPGVKDLLSARENLAWLARLHGTDVDDAAIRNALERVALSGYEDIACGALSEGQRKRVNLARLFLLRSPAWVLDEPFSSIDREGVKALQSLMAEHCRAGGIILLTSHQAMDVPAPVNAVMLGKS